MEASAKPMTLDMKDSTLEAVIDYLKDKSGVQIIVPQKVLDEMMITYKTPVSVDLKQVTMRTILKKVLADVGLVYIVKDNVIQVTTPEIASKTLTTRTYYMGDLLTLTDVRIPAYARQAEAIRRDQRRDRRDRRHGRAEQLVGERRPRPHRLRSAYHVAGRDADGGSSLHAEFQR